MNSSQFMNAIGMISAVSSLFPVVVESVHAIEQAIPQAGAGQTKLALVKTWVEEAFNALQTSTTTFTAVWPVVEKTIATLVAFYNTSGVFKKADAPAQ